MWFKLYNDRWSLRACKRGPTLLQDFHFYRKQSRFNRERIPEKVVHARGFGLFGEFETYHSMKDYTVADFLQTPGKKTPVFVRFSNFIGSRGSKDTAIRSEEHTSELQSRGHLVCRLLLEK